MPIQSLQIGNSGFSKLSRNVKVNNNAQQLRSQQKHPDMNYRLHRKLTSSKSAPSPHGETSSSKTTVAAKPQQAGSHSVPKTSFKMIARPSSGGQSNSMHQNCNLRWTKDEKLGKSQKQGFISKTTRGKVMPMNPKNLTKNPLPSSSKPLIKTASLSSLNQHSSSVRKVVPPTASKPLTKATRVPLLPTTDSNHTSTSNKRIVTLPKASQPHGKTTILSKILSRASPSRVTSRSPTLNRSVVNLPKSTSNVINNNNIGVAHSTTTSLDRRIVHVPKTISHSPSKSSIQSSTWLDRRTTLALTPSNKSTRTTKNNLPNAPVSKGAKLKWRRKSVTQVSNDSSSKNPKSKDLFGNELQTRIALKAKWRKVKANSTTLKTTVSGSRYRHSKAAGGHQATKGKQVFRSQHTKDILQSRTIPRRSRLKWSKTLSQSNLSTENDQSVVRRIQAKFAHKSRFSLKRKKSSEGMVCGIRRNHLQWSRVRTGAIHKFRSQNKGFVARLVEDTMDKCVSYHEDFFAETYSE
jgi:hypothetical protein